MGNKVTKHSTRSGCRCLCCFCELSRDKELQQYNNLRRGQNLLTSKNDGIKLS